MKTYYYILLLLLISSCSNTTTNTTTGITIYDSIIDFNEAFNIGTQKRYIYDIVDSVIVIPLETTEESLLSHFDNIEIGNDYIYILDSYKQGNVAIFDKKGKFIKRLPVGQAKEEVFNVRDLTFDFVKNELICYLDGGIIKKFTADGNFISEYRHYYIVHDMIPLKSGKGYIVTQAEGANSSNLFTILWTDTCFNILQSMNVIFKSISSISPHQLNYDKNGNINLTHFLDKKIYTITDTNMYIKQQLNFEKYELIIPEIDNPLDFMSFDNQKQNDKFYFSGRCYCETDNYEIFDFNARNWPSYVFYRNKKNGEIRGPIERDGYDNSLLESPNLHSHTYGNFFISIYSIYYEDMLKLQKNSEVFSQEQMKIFENFSEDDNPILVLYSLK